MIQLRCPYCGGGVNFYDSGENRELWKCLDCGKKFEVKEI